MRTQRLKASGNVYQKMQCAGVGTVVELGNAK